MPELPEVETMRRGVLPIVGRDVSEIVLPPCKLKRISILPSLAAIRKALVGRRVQGVSRLGKRVLVDFAEHSLILQPKMAGLVTLGEVPSREHLRFEMRFRGKQKVSLFYWDRRGLGGVHLLHRDEIQQQVVDGKLGPDALDIEFDEFYRRFQATRRPIKVALLDQKLVAGVGNLYASEILYAARVSPLLASKDVSRKRMRRVYDFMLAILLEAIEKEGSTLSDGTYRNSLNDPGSYQNHHRVYDRAGANCECGRAEIQRIVQAQRSTFYCPRCQK